MGRDDQTAVAQAEVEDREAAPSTTCASRCFGCEHDLDHAPQLGACVAVVAHPDDALPLFGKTAVTLFRTGADLGSSRRPEKHGHPDGLHIRRPGGRRVLARPESAAGT
jgi:hypothetical protein